MLVLSSSWTPSLARTAAVVEPAGAQLRGVTVAALPLAWPDKAPVEQLDYTLDLSAWLADDDDVLTSLAVTITSQSVPTDLGLVWASIINGNPTVFLAGGTQGTSYVVALQVTTAGGRVGLFPVSLAVTAASASTAPPPALAAPPNAIATSAGVLTLDNGSPLLLA